MCQGAHYNSWYMVGNVTMCQLLCPSVLDATLCMTLFQSTPTNCVQVTIMFQGAQCYYVRVVLVKGAPFSYVHVVMIQVGIFSWVSLALVQCARLTGVLVVFIHYCIFNCMQVVLVESAQYMCAGGIGP